MNRGSTDLPSPATTMAKSATGHWDSINWSLSKPDMFSSSTNIFRAKRNRPMVISEGLSHTMLGSSPLLRTLAKASLST